MNDLTPRLPIRPLLWPDAVLDLTDLLADSDQPVHIVGGAVRDAWFGAPLHDCDIVTPTGATRLARRIADMLNGDVYVMDAERDVARVMAETPQGRLSIDVAAYRGPDLLTDLIERDFTVNAMAADVRDPFMLIDPLDGESDLTKKLIRRCTEHAITHDPIRALRAVRQSIQLNAHIEKETMRDIRAAAPRLYETSPERVRDEFIKILATARPHTALRVMLPLGLLAPVLPDVAALPEADRDRALATVEHIAAILIVISPRRTDNTAAAFGLGSFVVALDAFRRKLQAHLDTEWANERPHRALLHLAALLRAGAAGNAQVVSGAQSLTQYMDQAAEHLRLSNPERARLLTLLKANVDILTSAAPLDVLAQHRFWHTNGVGGVDAVLVGLAHTLAVAGVQLDQDHWVRTLERARLLFEAWFMRQAEVVAPPPVIDGNLLMSALQLKPGPIIRDLLDAIREGQVTGRVTDTESALALAREYIETGRG